MGIASDVTTCTNQTKDISGNGNINYMGFGVPLIKGGKWVASFGFNPYSNMNYKLFSEELVRGVDGSLTSALVNHDYEGTGGLSQLYFSNGFKLSDDFHLVLRVHIYSVAYLVIYHLEFQMNHNFILTSLKSHHLMILLYSRFVLQKRNIDDKFLKFRFIYDFNNV